MAASEADAGDDADKYRIRLLELSDISKCFRDLLAQLSPCAPLTEDAFRTRFAELMRLGEDHLVLVAEDAATGRISAGAVLVECKFIRCCDTVGHVEDARGRGCYKVILNCTPELTGFYAKVGFEEKNVQMGLYF